MENEHIQPQTQFKITGVIFVFLTLALFFHVPKSTEAELTNKNIEAKKYTLKIMRSSAAMSIEKINPSAKFTELDNGFFNLSSSSFAVVSIKCIQLCFEPERSWVSVFRNNHFAPIYLTYLNDGEQIKQLLIKTTSDNKLVRTQLPEMNRVQEIFIVLSGKYLRGQITISGEEKIFDNIKTASSISGMYYGVAGTFILFSLVLAILTKSVTYTSYALMLFITALWVASGEGWLNYLSPSWSRLPFFTAISSA